MDKLEIEDAPAFFRHADSNEILRVDAMGDGGDGMMVYAYDCDKTLHVFPFSRFVRNFSPVKFPDYGEIWEHGKSGDNYRILACGFIEKTLQRCVIYKSSSFVAAPVWVRPLDEFLWRFTKVCDEKEPA